MKLHIGCGKRDFGGEWVHIDGAHYDHVSYHNIRDLPFKDNVADLIYASHVFEYFDRKEAHGVLMEWRRVLKFGGTLRLAVPDFKKIAGLYFNSQLPLSMFLGPLYGRMEMFPGKHVIENVMDIPLVYHKTVYDHDSLKEVLEAATFCGVRSWDWRTTEHSQFDDFSQAYIPHMDKKAGTLISLNLEATK
jgi:predicted SAM-dependent methyltransferase